jgi:drug/metabolite transporter (DMT)-like permease
MTPLFTIAISIAFFRKSYSRSVYSSLVLVIAGVVFATYGDYYVSFPFPLYVR